MALIKNRNAGGLATRRFRDVGDLGRQAEGIVEAARADAARIVEEAARRADTLAAEAAPRGFDEGRERGLREGRDEGRRLGREEAIGQYTASLAALGESWGDALAAFEADRCRILQTAREDIVELVLAVAGRLARRTIEADPSIVQDQVVEVLSLVTAPSRVTLSINPADRELVQAVLPSLCERMHRAAHVELRGDPEIERGGCVLSTGRGVIDASLRTQAERIAEALLPATSGGGRRNGA